MTLTAVTRTCQDDFSTSGLLTALESGWSAIRGTHPDVPRAVIVVGSGSPARPSSAMTWGHFASSQWQHGGDRVAEVMVSGEGLRRLPQEVFTTLLHEAAHGMAATRAIADTSRQGRWHNKRFAGLAEEIGLTVTKNDKFGWSTCELRPSTTERYGDVLALLGSAMSAYRHPKAFTTGQRSNSNNGHVLECACPRKIRVSASTVAKGPILCGVCETSFVVEESG